MTRADLLDDLCHALTGVGRLLVVIAILALLGCASDPEIVYLNPGESATIPGSREMDEAARRAMHCSQCPECGEWWPDEFLPCQDCEAKHP